ncbi:MAG: GAF domain-containing sensor histidine kinase [Anaerolineae bacterium]|nr:GAF domain-containing sensor histidine kinase [Anaerolineae bacterium]
MSNLTESMNKEQIASMQNRMSNLERLLRLMQVINSTLETDPLLDIIVQVATELTNTESASILLVDEESGELRFVAATGQSSADLKPIPVPIEGSVAGTVVTGNKPLLIRDAPSDPRWYQDVDRVSGIVTHSLAAVPMQVRGKVIGVVEALNKRGGGEMTWDDVDILSTLATQAAVAIQNAHWIAALQVAYNKLNELDRLKSEFIAVAAHELRTPLSLILGYATFLREEASGTAKEQVDIVLQSAIRLRLLIEDMVSLRQVDAGEAALKLETVELHDLVDSAVREIQSMAEAKGQEIVLSSRHSGPIVTQVDRAKMIIVLVKLLSNAIKYTSRGGRIGVQTGRDADNAWFTVWDTGIGISATDLSRIFDRFYQVEPSLARRYEGLGLGLAIAKEMVELHRGHIRVQSQEGKGSAFTVTLPIHPPS